MICGADEFLLVLQKWITDSAKVTLHLCIFREEPLNPSLGGRIQGRIVSAANNPPGFIFLSDNEDTIAVDVEGWAISFGADAKIGDDTVDAFTLHIPGTLMNLWANFR